MNNSLEFKAFMLCLNTDPDGMQQECITLGRKRMSQKHNVSLSTVTKHIIIPPGPNNYLDVEAINALRRSGTPDKIICMSTPITISVLLKRCGSRKSLNGPVMQGSISSESPASHGVQSNLPLLNTVRWTYEDPVHYWL